MFSKGSYVLTSIKTLYRAEQSSPAWSFLPGLLPEYPIDHRSTVSDLQTFGANWNTDLRACISPITTSLDFTFESERVSVVGSTSPPSTHHRTSSDELSRTTSSTEEKSRRFPKFKLSLTAPPPKPKTNQPGKVPPPVVSDSPFSGVLLDTELVLRLMGCLTSALVVVAAQEMSSGSSRSTPPPPLLLLYQDVLKTQRAILYRFRLRTPKLVSLSEGLKRPTAPSMNRRVYHQKVERWQYHG